MKTVLRILYTLLCIMIGFYFGDRNQSLIGPPDYIINFVHQGDSVRIQSVGDDHLYTVPYDSLVSTIEKDNL